MKSRSPEDFDGYAEVITWGTQFEGGNGLKEQIRAKFKGGNIGHAAIRLTIPADDKAETLIEKYCYDNDKIIIPHTKKDLPNGKKVYEVYISAWGENARVTLNRDFIWDSMEERTGVHFDWDPKWSAEINPDVRSYRGLTDKTTMQLGPQTIIHQRGSVSKKQYEDMLNIYKYKSYLKKIENFNFLEDRLRKLDSKNPKLGETEKLLLDKLLPHWKDNVKKPPKISKNELTTIFSLISSSRDSHTNAKENLRLIETMREIANKELLAVSDDIRNDFRKWGVITPKTAQKIIDIFPLLGVNNFDDIDKICLYTRSQINDVGIKIKEVASKGISSNDLFSYYRDYEPKDKMILGDAFSFGMSPDHVVQIPLQSLAAKAPANDGTLNVEAMLSRANQVATSHEKFSLTGTNCSKVTGWVLQAGTQGTKEGEILSREALGQFGTPQLVLNNSIKYLNKTSKKAKKNYDKEIKLRLDKKPKEREERKPRSEPILGMQQISFDGIDRSLPALDQCKLIMDKFAAAITKGTLIPYLPVEVKLFIENAIQNNAELEDKFAKLCEAAILKAHHQSLSIQSENKDEWDVVNKMIDGKSHGDKISKSDHPDLANSYMVLEINGEIMPWRVSRNILGKGTEGKVKVLENEKGERLAIKVLKDKKELDSEIAIMKEAGEAKTSFVRKKEEKYSKSMSSMIGDKRYIVLPLHNGNEIQKEIATLSDSQKIELGMGCCKAIKVLHDQRILHRDIKPSNFITFIDKDGNVRSVNVIDFGGAVRTDKDGKVVAKPFGSPGYFASELGREEILKAGEEKYRQLEVVKNHSELIIQAQAQIDILNVKQRSAKGELYHLKESMFGEKSRFFPKKSHMAVMDALNGYDGTNRDDVIDKVLKLADKHSDKEMVKSFVINYCSNTDQLNRINQTIDQYTKKIESSQNAIKIAQGKADDAHSKILKLFNEEVINSFKSDIYALGVMLTKDFNLNLADLGLADMLNDDPAKRPTLDTVMSKLSGALKKDKKESVVEIDQQALEETSKFEGSVRCPKNVDPSTLHRAPNGNLSILSTDEMRELAELRKKQNNTHIQMNGKDIYITKEGGAFVMHSPIGMGATSSTYLVQNLDDHSWSVAKLVKGEERKIRGPLTQFNNENKTLDDLKLLNGTLDLSKDGMGIHIRIQPYSYGKTYEEILKESKTNDKSISIENTITMSLKALESLTSLHVNQQYLHRDIRPHTMIWDPVKNQCTLIDFVSARKSAHPGLEIVDATKKGSEFYQAPEIEFNKGYKEDRKYSEKTDIYSMGIVINELLALTKPDDHPAYQQLKQLQAELTNVNPQLRPTAQEAVQRLTVIQQSLVVREHQQDVVPAPKQTSTPPKQPEHDGTRIQTSTPSSDKKENIDWVRFDYLINDAIKDCQELKKSTDIDVVLEAGHKEIELMQIQKMPNSHSKAEQGIQCCHDVIEMNSKAYNKSESKKEETNEGKRLYNTKE